MGFEPTISAGERPKTYALDHAATGTGTVLSISLLNSLAEISSGRFRNTVPRNSLYCVTAIHAAECLLKSLELRTALFLDIMQRAVVISYRRLGATHQSQLQGSTPKMGPMVCSETSVGNYHYFLRNDPEERGSHLLRGGSLRSRKLVVVQLLSIILCDPKPH